MNLAAAREETAGLSPADHVRALAEHAPELRLDVVLADPLQRGRRRTRSRDAAAAMGGRVLLRQVGEGHGSARHDPLRLAAALRDVLGGAWGDVAALTAAGRTPSRPVAGCRPWR